MYSYFLNNITFSDSLSDSDTLILFDSFGGHDTMSFFDSLLAYDYIIMADL